MKWYNRHYPTLLAKWVLSVADEPCLINLTDLRSRSPQTTKVSPTANGVPTVDVGLVPSALILMGEPSTVQNAALASAIVAAVNPTAVPATANASKPKVSRGS